MNFKKLHSKAPRASRLFALTALSAACVAASHAETTAAAARAAFPTAQATSQIAQLLNEKLDRTALQAKLDSQLWYTLQASRGQAMSGMADVYASAADATGVDASGRVKVKISGTASQRVLSKIAAIGGTVQYVASKKTSVLATIPLAQVEALAALPDVQRIAPAPAYRTNVGALTSQGYIAHGANTVVAGGHDGTGVRVGVLSDSASPSIVATLISSGDLPPDVTVLPGQAGSGEDEGAAMMEIIHDVAPGAKLFFATADPTDAAFADNIRTLRDTYHCDIIVDDVTYFDEGVFQDGEIAQAVNDVTADGALYFSAAGNSGNVTFGTTGTWEGDFTPGPASGPPLPAGYTLHNFASGQAYDALTVATQYILAKWSDPLGASTNDYDLFVLNAAGTSVLCSSVNVQSGASDPTEFCRRNNSANPFPVGARIVIAKKASAATRALHLDTERGALTIGTSGATFGHNAGTQTVTLAATYWASAHTGTKPFVGGTANPIETFSSDGPRKYFYNADGTPITPGNFLFGTNGGETLVKPTITAADGVSTKTPLFLPFFGTSAAAPHAAAVAALVKSARPDYTNTQILNALQATALDDGATVGVDRDSGYGIVMAPAAVSYAISH
ncbi:MAG: S8 family serine peptidase [Proteobacteria bacterium]|nr:S8 family serine peptidase [Pseudomonadota bacterium]